MDRQPGPSETLPAPGQQQQQGQQNRSQQNRGEVLEDITVASPAGDRTGDANAHLYYASRGSLEELKKVVAKRGAGILSQPDPRGVTALTIAADKNHLHIAKYLLSNNVPTETHCGQRQGTPLHFAVHRGHFEMVVFLVRNGASLTSTEVDGCNALHLAARAGHLGMVAFFLANGADVDTVDNDGRTPLMLAAPNTYCIDVIYCLIAFNASVNKQDNAGNTAIHYAGDEKNEIALYALVKNNASSVIANNEGVTGVDAVHRAPRDLEGSKAKFWKPSLVIRRIIPSVSAQQEVKRFGRLHSDPMRRTMTIILPFLAIATALWLGNFISRHYIIGPFFIVPAVLTFRFLMHFFTFSYSTQPTPLMTGFYLSSVIIFVAVAFKLFVPLEMENGEPLVPQWVVAAILIDFAIFAVTFYLSHYGDPGCIDIPRHAQVKTINDLADEGHLDSRHYCPTCMIRKPLRSKHCSVLNRCVSLFDHYCPYVENTIGEKNHKAFVINVLSCLTGNVIFLIYAVKYMMYMSPPLVWEWTPLQWFAFSPTVFLLLVQNVGTIVMLGRLLANQVYLTCFTGLTTNEKINQHRYHYLTGRSTSPWTRGVIGNCIHFFFGKSDWSKVYETPDDPWNKFSSTMA